MTPWLSVIIPVHRGAEFLNATLSSAAAERPEGVEFLIYDSGEDDGASKRVVDGFHDRLSIVWHDTPNLKPWTAKTNVGVEQSRAPHVCTLHQDDIWLPGRAAAIRAWIKSAPQAALHLAPTAIIGADGRNLGTWRCPFSADAPIPSPVAVERLLVQNFVAVPTPVFRRDAWLECGGMDTALWYTADWDVWLKLASLGPVHYHDVVTTGFRVHAGSLTMTGSVDAADFESQMRIVLDRHVGRLASARSAAVRRVAGASIKVNAALAVASSGRWGAVGMAVGHVLALGPQGIYRYFRDSRLHERVVPRLRAKLSGAF